MFFYMVDFLANLETTMLCWFKMLTSNITILGEQSSEPNAHQHQWRKMEAIAFQVISCLFQWEIEAHGAKARQGWSWHEGLFYWIG